MKLRALALLLLAVSASASAQNPTRRALLLGIDTYQPAGTSAQHPAGCIYGRCELGTFPNLHGSVNDATALADVLTSPKYAFAAANVALLTNPASTRARPGVTILPASATTHDGILAAMRKYLVDLPQPGDFVLFYAASHGSLRINSKGTKLPITVDGKPTHADSTLVPSDAYLGGFDIRDREMTRIFNAALDKGIHLTVLLDSCHSGASTRALSQYTARSLAFDPRDIAELPDPQPAPTERSTNPALVLTAVQQDQEAKEANAGGEPHGAFTAALIEALESLPADSSAATVYRRIRAALEANGVPNQDPDLDANTTRREQPLFGPATANTHANTLQAAALQTTPAGTVWLDAGRASGIGIGTTFVSSGANPIELRVLTLEGLARSTAEIVSPAAARIHPGDLFTLKQWIPAQKPLLVWLPPANLTQQEILAAASAVQASGIPTVQDPAEEPWTHRLDWTGTLWRLTAAPASLPIEVAPPLTAAKLRQLLAPTSRLWLNLPPSRELAAQLALSDPTSTLQLTSDPTQAAYLLAGTITSNGPAYAWFHHPEFNTVPSAATPRHTPGCSTTSSWPIRTAWLPPSDAADLNLYGLRLAKVAGWLALAANPTATPDTFYHLALSRTPDTPPLPSNQPVRAGDSLLLSLTSPHPVQKPRWVYVLDIDCQGAGNLLYPIDYSENRFPPAESTALRIPLAGARTIDVGPPFGVDTLLMLSSEQPLPDPAALNFEGVAPAPSASGTRSLGGPPSPLAELLGETSAGTRGIAARHPVPTTWSLDLLPLLSEPTPQ